MQRMNHCLDLRKRSIRKSWDIKEVAEIYHIYIKRIIHELHHMYKYISTCTCKCNSYGIFAYEHRGKGSYLSAIIFVSSSSFYSNNGHFFEKYSQMHIHVRTIVNNTGNHQSLVI